MRSHMMKSGNSLAVRIPKSYAEDIGLENNTPVELHVKNGSIILTPEKKKYDLKQMIDMISDDNMHKETDTGAPVGNEVW